MAASSSTPRLRLTVKRLTGVNYKRLTFSFKGNLPADKTIVVRFLFSTNKMFNIHKLAIEMVAFDYEFGSKSPEIPVLCG
jgi:hypothetical protein